MQETLRLYTVDATNAGRKEVIKGTLEPGKLAYLIVLSADILTMPQDEIKSLLVEYYVVEIHLA